MGKKNTRRGTDQDGAAIRFWLFGLCLMIFAMIMVGGATRLTDSGLSITEWQPLIGMVPPMSDTAWQDAFEKYKLIPEYELVNKGMTLSGFKFIYWWEWAHRFLGRLIGFAFLIPFLVFWKRGQISRALMPRLVVMFLLGGLQGALGWYMVKSGLVERVDVSQYRLAAHLTAAVFIFGYIFWVAIRLGSGRQRSVPAGRGVCFSAGGLTAAVFLQIALGAFVAGLDAGQGYNTWPLMDGVLIPDGLGAMSPWHINLFENALTVQFNHRMVAYLLTAWALIHAGMVITRNDAGPHFSSAGLVALAVVAQVALGIATLLAKAPLGLSLAHQAMAIIVFALALAHLNRMLPAPVRDRR